MMISKTLSNIVANYSGKLWGIISVYLFIPIYIKLLGIESYAIISFQVVIATLMYVADAGLSASFSREVAKTTDKEYLGNLLKTLERIYFVIIGIVILTTSFFSYRIASNWLRSDTIQVSEIAICIACIGIVVAFQMIASMYTGGLMGLQKQVLANKIQVGYSAFRSGLVIIPIYFMPNLYVYFVWQIFSSILFLLFSRHYIWKEIRLANYNYKYNFKLLRGIWRFALGMMFMAIIAGLNTQIDKLITSKLLSLTEYGYYGLASTLAQAPNIVSLPIAIAILPLLTKLSNAGNIGELKSLYERFSFIIAVFSSIITVVIVLYSKELIYIWTGNLIIAKNTGAVAVVLSVGSLFLSLQLMPYHLAIANGSARINVIFGLISLSLIIPALIFFIGKYGTIGASFPWLILNLCAFVVLGYILTNKFINNEFLIWLFKGNIVPCLVTFSIGYIIHLITADMNQGYCVLIYSSVIGLIAVTLNLMIFNHLFASNKIYITQFKIRT